MFPIFTLGETILGAISDLILQSSDTEDALGLFWSGTESYVLGALEEFPGDWQCALTVLQGDSEVTFQSAYKIGVGKGQDFSFHVVLTGLKISTTVKCG